MKHTRQGRTLSSHLSPSKTSSREDLNQPEYSMPSSSDYYNSPEYQQQQEQEFSEDEENDFSTPSNTHQNTMNTNSATNMSMDNLAQTYKIPGLNYSNLLFKPQGYSSSDTNNNQINDISTLFKTTQSKGVFKIVGRVRPLNKSSYLLTEGNKIMEIGEDHRTVLVGKYLNKVNPSATSFQFTFDRVFDEYANQSLFYSSCGYPLFKSFVSGANANIITYGQTRAGKSYTLEGIGEDERRGLIPRFVEDVFKFIYTYGQGQGVYNAKFNLSVSFVQIYNDIITDLLSSNNTKGLKVAEEKTRTVILGMKKHVLRDPKDIFTVLKYAKQNRSVTTGMKPPDLHTRSHSILTLYLDQSWPQLVSASSTSLDIQTHTISSKVTFVELAGSEKAREFSQVLNTTPNVSEEGSKIAKTFNALAAVASGLGKLLNASPISNISLNSSTLSSQSNTSTNSTNQNKYYVPYRDSKLTHVLRDTMREDTFNLFITSLYPLPDNYTEILSSSKYSSRIRQCLISNNPYLNTEANLSAVSAVSQFPSPVKNSASVNNSPSKRVSFNQNNTSTENVNNISNTENHKQMNAKDISKRLNNSNESIPIKQQSVNTPTTQDSPSNSIEDEVLNSFKEERNKVKLESEELRKILSIESVTRKNFQKNIEHLEQELIQSDDERKELREKFVEMSEKMQDLSATNMKLQESFTLSKVEVEKLMEQKSDLEEEIERNRKYIIQLTKENGKLNDQVISGRENFISTTAKSQIEALELENKELRMKQHTVESQVTRELQQLVESLRNEIKLKDVSFTELLDQLKEMKHNNYQLTEELESKQDFLNQTQQDMEDLRIEVEGLSSTLESKESEIEEVYGQVEQLPALNNEIQRLDRIIKKLSEENQDLQSKLEEIQSTASAEQSVLQEEKSDFEQKVRRLSNELERERRERETLQSELNRLNTKYTSMSSSSETEIIKRDETIKLLKNDLEMSMRAAENTINDLKNNLGLDLEEKTKMSSELHATCSKKLELEVDLKKLQSQFTLLKKENDEKSKQVKSLSDEVFLLNSDKNRTESEMKNQVSTLKEKLVDIQKQSDLTIYQLKEDNKSLEGRINSLKDTNNTRSSQLEEALFAKKTLEEQLNKLVQSCGIEANSKHGLDKEIEKRVENSMRLTSLEKQAQQRKNEMDQLYSQMEQKDLELDRLKKESYENRLEIQTLRNASEEYEYTITTLKTNLNQCSEDRRNLRDENILLMSSNDKKDDLVRKLKREIEVVKMDLESIVTEKENVQNMLKKTINNTSGVHDDLSQTKFELIELARERDTFEMQYLSSEKKCKGLEDDLATKDIQISDLKYAIDCAKRENNNPMLEESVRRLTDENKNLSKQCSDLKVEKETLTQEKKVSDAQFNHYKSLHNDSLKLVEDLKKEYESRCRELSDCKEAIEHLSSQIEEKSLSLLRASELNMDNETELEKKCDEIDYLKVCLEDVNKKARDYADTCKSLESTIERLEKQVQQTIDEANTYRNGLEKKDTENNELFMRYKLLEIDRDDAKKQLEKSQKELAEIENSYLELRSSQETVTSSLESSQEQVAKLNEEKNMIENQLRQVQGNIEEMADQIQKDQDEREMFISRMIKFERTIQTLTKEKQQIESKLATETNQAIQKLTNIEQQEASIREFETTIEQLEQQNKSLQQTITDMTKQMITVEDEKRKLCRTVVDIESELERVKKAYEKTNRELKSMVNSFVYQN